MLALWQVVVPWAELSEFVLPTPFAIAGRMFRERWLLSQHAYFTLIEVVAGFLVGALIGIPLALAIFYSRVFERAIYPILVALQTVPKVALAPLLVLYLGYGWAPKVSLGLSYIVLSNRDIDGGRAELGRQKSRAFGSLDGSQ